jgi:hypothetical protein
MKPPDSQKAIAMSQGISEEKAEKACAKVSVPVIIVAPRPSIATAPSGSGCVMIPTIVPRKIARRCHAAGATPAGEGANQTSAPTPTQMASFFRSAPHLMPSAAGGGAAAATAAAAEAAAGAGARRGAAARRSAGRPAGRASGARKAARRALAAARAAAARGAVTLKVSDDIWLGARVSGGPICSGRGPIRAAECK